MADSERGMVASYREPRTATELARAIEVFILDSLGRSLSGGLNKHGGVFDLPLDGEGEVSVVVMPCDRWNALLVHAGRTRTNVFYESRQVAWLDDEEVNLIEDHRSAKRALRKPL